MTRRSFLKRFAIAAAGVGLGANLFTSKRPQINPAWVNARYETSVVFGDFGQHFYELERAYEPVNPSAVVAILHK
jgi:hypothetical protein